MVNRKKLLKLTLELTVFVSLFVAISLFLSRNMLSTESEVPELQLPQLITDATQGAMGISNPEIISWKVADKTLVYFFAPWCGVCRISMPGLSLLAEDNAQIVVVALDWQNAGEIRKFVQDVGYKGKVLLGDEATKSIFQIDSYPSYYVINNSGQVVHRDRGLSTPPGLWFRLN